MGAAANIESLFDQGFHAHCNGDLEAASRYYRQVLRIVPRHNGALKALGVLCFSSGGVDKGISLLAECTQAWPDDAEAWSNYGNALRAVERHRESADACRRAVTLNSQDGTAHSNLAAALRCLSHLGESIHHAQRAVELAPQLAEAHINLASGFLSVGETNAALAVLIHAAETHASHLGLRQSLLFTSLYSDQIEDSQIRQLHSDVGSMLPRGPRPSKRGKCRTIGFVSGDFRSHPVGRFMSSLLPHLDRSRHRIALYSNLHDQDTLSLKIAGSADIWRPIYGRSDAQVAEWIREDEVDVLVDLSGHSAQNRMTLFALGACAVQATWLGYSSTTGIPAMDWFIGDHLTNPVGTDSLYTERVARLNHAFLCDEPLTQVPEAQPHEGIVFGSFNNTSKISPACVALWSRVLTQVPESRMVLKYSTLGDPAVQQVVRDRFAVHGISPDRLEFCGYQSKQDHADLFRRVDLFLDSAPYTGATTTVDALRNGAPVLTLPGQRYSARMSASILGHSRLDDFVATNEEEYVAKAVKIAQDPATHRAQVGAAVEGPIYRPDLFAHDLQDVLDSIWQLT